MASLGNINLKDNTGKEYTFQIYNLNSNWNEVSVVYVVAKATNDRTLDIIYIGQTGNLNERMSNHHKAYCFNSRNADRLCVLIENNESRRLNIESGLIGYYSPPCND